MISFENDYNAGAHPKVIQRLVETNLEPLSGYGTDEYCESAKEKIKSFIKCQNAEIFFLTGGTQTNQIVIDTMLEPYEGVIAAKTGHVSMHEAGAIEFSGHKVLELESHDGKINADELKTYLLNFYADENHEHMVFPGMVYISYPTEYGTLYSKNELEKISAICKEYDIKLYIDGARLAYGLCSKQADLKIEEIATLCDVFYIGGTKAGALCGEALVFTKGDMPKHFLTQVKQHGALLAKGRLLGVQFDALFTDNLYLEIGNHAIEQAEKLKDLFRKKNCELYLDSPTNQQFIIVDDKKAAELARKVKYSFWEKLDENRTVIRFVTSWSTTGDDIAFLEKIL